MNRSLIDVLNKPKVGRCVTVTATTSGNLSEVVDFVSETRDSEIQQELPRGTFQIRVPEEFVEELDELDAVDTMSVDGPLRFEGNS